ncbi:hypothetical protein D3C76_1833330 [compost metagenome]
MAGLSRTCGPGGNACDPNGESLSIQPKEDARAYEPWHLLFAEYIQVLLYPVQQNLLQLT